MVQVATRWNSCAHPIAATPDRPVLLLPGQVRLHLLDLPVTLGELDHRDLVGVGERAHRPAELITDPTHHHRRRDREPAQRQELHDLTTDLQIRHIPVEIDPVQTLQVQAHMPIQNVRRPSPAASPSHTPDDQPDPDDPTATRADASQPTSSTTDLGGPRRSLARLLLETRAAVLTAT